MNGEDRRRKVAFLLLALAAVMAVASAAFAVQITVAGVDQLGGTPMVDVNCPASSCQINRVKWVLTESYPYLVDKVVVRWTPASGTSSYTVCVTLFDGASSPNTISGGCTTGVSGSTTINTEVDVTNVAPALVYKVQIVIFEE